MEQPTRRNLVVIAALFLSLTALAAPPNLPPGFRAYESPYYTVQSDLPPERVREAIVRMSRMAEEYHDRTREFSGAVKTRLSFYLFTDEQDYHNAGGPIGSGGVFLRGANPPRLMGLAGKNGSPFIWHTIQHEGFHQFAHAVIGGQLPTWLNEGLAEYFGEGLFTGDGFVTGVIPPRRLREIQEGITNKAFKRMSTMLRITQRAWNMEIAHENYTMAWSMAHFLAHGDDGRYQAAFVKFVKDLGASRPAAEAWEANFGAEDGFEKKWAEWWMSQKPGVTKDLHVKAVVSTLASFVGRAATQKQTFEDLADLAARAKQNAVKIPTGDDWLPPTLLASMLGLKERLGPDVTYSLNRVLGGPPQVVAVMADSTRIVATYTPTPKPGAGRVTVTIDDMAVVIARAKALIADKKNGQAKLLLQDAIKRNPKSPHLEEARKTLQLAV